MSCFIDHAFLLEAPDTGPRVFLNGWIKGAEPYGVAAADGSAISKLDFIRYRRPDVGALFAELSDGEYGFVAAGEWAQPEAPVFVASVGGKLLKAAETNCVAFADAGQCAEALLEIGFEWSESEKIYRFLVPFLVDAPRVRAAIYVNERRQGVRPLNSVLIPVYGDEERLALQAIGLSLDWRIKNSNDEVIYILANPALNGRMRALIDSLRKLYNLPCRVVEAGRFLGASEAWLLGLENAKGDNYLFLPETALPQQPEWKFFRGKGDMKRAAIITGQTLNDGSSPVFPPETGLEDGRPLSRVPWFSKPVAIHVPGRVYEATGGFTSPIFTAYACLAEYGRRLEQSGHGFLCGEDLGFSFFPEQLSPDSPLAWPRQILWDRAVYSSGSGACGNLANNKQP